ncbi:hypothetical protein [Streptomyces canus]|uniref:Uncharacterized protein n=1 Tax=Streptomyces canus TaxID=58343 RepID=A0AAW8FNR3_9ACTN|nr:hypothetical protein [Streptomyces canus]MDQ0760606.1 hypothetical protein [Streptomyces canus]MDQ0910750.1 hypothetical protein [Streptomyces canus]MDQ1070771.1 hypothetical protein [Streptomyces canus]
MTTPGVKAQMPTSVRLALVGVWVQAVLNLAAGFLLLALVNDAADHGQDEGAGLLRFLAVLSLLIAGALLLCGVFAGKRSNGIRVTVIVIEALSLLIGVLGLLQGGFSALPGIVFALVVLRNFSAVEARNWFDR